MGTKVVSAIITLVVGSKEFGDGEARMTRWLVVGGDCERAWKTGVVNGEWGLKGEARD
jgi:hypothetical protein